MKLPNRELTYVPREKLTGYLLSETHPDGKAKARFLRALGFDETNTDLLEQHLLVIARSEDVVDVLPSGYGTKYIIDGAIEAPSGRSATLRTVWIVETGQDRPRLVTAYPGRGAHERGAADDP
jgi:hypothetical protein